jgi:hypothetical protein
MSTEDVIPVVLESKPEKAHRIDVKLAQTLTLEGEWEVGLQELIAPQTWNNITGENKRFAFKCAPRTVGGKPANVDWEYRELPEGYYATVADLLAAIKALTEKEGHEGHILFSQNPQTRKVTIACDKEASVAFSTKQMKSELGELLGFTAVELDGGKKHEAEYPPILDSVQSLYVYCDCIKPIRVGDVIAQLLHTVPITVDRPRFIYASYSDPRFIPVSKQVIDRIALSIRSNTGKPISFRGGNCFVKLLFRKIS